MTKIAILGAGSWGTALAILLSKNGHRVALWDRDPQLIAELQHHQRNTRYLPEIKLPELLLPSGNLNQAVANAEVILIAIPSIGFCDLLSKIKSAKKPIIWATKGLEPKSNQLLHTIIKKMFGPQSKAAVLSGPSFAREVAQGLPTAVVIASEDEIYAKWVISLFANAQFRPYYSDDVIGVEIGGIVKNVMAIAAGISDGLSFGANTRAALITHSLDEITRLAIALGGRAETLTGLSGLGDLILTCTDNQSRNRRFGLALGKGLSVEQATKEIGQVIEGAQNVEQVMTLAKRSEIDMPITKHVQQVLRQQITPQQAVESLFARELRAE